ncbi:hypothetical protein [Rhizobium sp. BK176]|uniref:hypothetical protein n=1 Tax=Rhizobium sp. BK176 TaxID=2587071 RepID=UPI0021698DC7|nr:hypothetical protein [Rhizobium sp. BK176]MCS4088996.1 hypothetical protein [Rhizobium sp. BK176]
MTTTARKIVVAALAVFAGMATQSRAEVGGGRIVVEYAEKAIAKGYGAMCSLAMTPVVSGGYYPCIDFGPYRYVRGYESVAAFVVQKDKAPFKIMGGTAQSPGFVIDGPWVQDLPMRMVAYWNDVIEGGADKLKQSQETSGRKRAAEEYINSLVKKEKPSEPPVPAAPAPQPVVGDQSKDEIGKPVDAADLKEALQAVGQ